MTKKEFTKRVIDIMYTTESSGLPIDQLWADIEAERGIPKDWPVDAKAIEWQYVYDGARGPLNSTPRPAPKYREEIE